MWIFSLAKCPPLRTHLLFSPLQTPRLSGFAFSLWTTPLQGGCTLNGDPFFFFQGLRGRSVPDARPPCPRSVCALLSLAETSTRGVVRVTAGATSRGRGGLLRPVIRSLPVVRVHRGLRPCGHGELSRRLSALVVGPLDLLEGTDGGLWGPVPRPTEGPLGERDVVPYVYRLRVSGRDVPRLCLLCERAPDVTPTVPRTTQGVRSIGTDDRDSRSSLGTSGRWCRF